MSWTTSTIRRRQRLPKNATERAVYREASVDPEGAELVLAMQLDPRVLRLPTSAHAAALEDLARAVRIELTEQEQSALQHETHESKTPSPDRHQGGDR